METPLVPEVLLQHGQFVRALAHSLLRDSHAAEDVAQETWARYFAHPPAEERGLRSWLCTVARNLAANLGRAERRRSSREEQAARAEALPAAESELEQAELLQAVVEAVLALDEPQRETILARYWRGLDAEQVAAEIGASAATVRSREQRALVKLRERLDRRFRGERAAWALGLARVAGPPPTALGRGPMVGKSSSGAKLAAVLGIVAASVVGLRWIASSAGSSPNAARGSSASLHAPEPSTAQDTLAPRSMSGAAPSAREAVESTSSGAASSEALTAPPGYVLTGVLRHSSNGRPAPGVGLSFINDAPDQEQYIEILTDSEGRFTTDSLLPGILRPWVLSDLGATTIGKFCNVRPARFTVPIEAQELELFLVDPEAWLEVKVVARGAPCANAELVWGFEEEDRIQTRWEQRTDELGRIRVGFPSVGPGKHLHLLAYGGDDLVSDPVVMSDPPDTPMLLELEPGARILVHAFDSAGAPAVDRELRLGCEQPSLHELLRSARTDAAGIARIVVPRGRFFVGIGDSAHESSAWQEVEVEAGSETVVELRLDEVPVALSGRVVDEQGAPLPHVCLVVGHDEYSETFLADADGRFIYRLAGTGMIRLWTNSSLSSDRFEPSELEVPFGTTGVLVRRVEARRLTTVDLEVVTAASSPERIRDVHPKLFRRPATFDSLSTMSEGLGTVELPACDDIDLVLDAPGYRRRSVRVMDLLREPGIQRVALEPGLDRGLVIQDNQDGRPLAGAVVMEGNVRVGTADDEGRVKFDLDHWPKELLVTSLGYESRTWQPSDWLDEDEDCTVYLDRTEASSK